VATETESRPSDLKIPTGVRSVWEGSSQTGTLLDAIKDKDVYEGTIVTILQGLSMLVFAVPTRKDGKGKSFPAQEGDLDDDLSSEDCAIDNLRYALRRKGDRKLIRSGFGLH